MLHENVHRVPAKDDNQQNLKNNFFFGSLPYPKDFVSFLVPTGLLLEEKKKKKLSCKKTL